MGVATAMTERRPPTNAQSRADRRRPHRSARRRPRPRRAAPSRSRSGSARTSSGYLVPLVLPIAVVVGLVAYVLNISRMFLSAHGHIPIIVGSVITVADPRSARRCCRPSPQLRQSAITLVERGVHPRRSCRAAGSCSGTRSRRRRARRTLPATLKTKQTRSRSPPRPAGSSRSRPTAHGQDRPREDQRHGRGRRATRSPSHDPTTLFAALEPRTRPGRRSQRRRVLRQAGQLHVLLRDPRPRGRGHEGHDHGDRPAADAARRRCTAAGQRADAAGRLGVGSASGTRTVSASRTASIVAGQRADALAVGVDLHRDRRVERLELDVRAAEGRDLRVRRRACP